MTFWDILNVHVSPTTLSVEKCVPLATVGAWQNLQFITAAMRQYELYSGNARSYSRVALG